MEKAIYQGFYQTPPLWKNQQFGLQQFQFPNLGIAALATPTLPSNLRLGHQMEYVFKHLISASSTYDVLLNNILVEEGKVRIGELDFILKKLETNTYIHL